MRSEIVIHFLLSFIYSLDFKSLFVPLKQIREVSIGPSPRTLHVTFRIREEIGENPRLLAED